MQPSNNKTRDIIEINEDLCNGCGQCVTGCAEGALAIVAGKAKLVSDVYCDGLGACLGHCPTGALKVVRRAAPDFDEEAAMRHVKQMKKEDKLPCGCPGSQVRELPMAVHTPPSGQCTCAKNPQLANWPIQLKLIPSHAPFLNNKIIVLAADCSAFTGPLFHHKFCVNAYPLIIACPKLDDIEAYIKKLTNIFSTHKNIEEVWLPMMSVPCCRGLAYMVNQALEKSSADERVRVKSWLISPQGDISEE